MGNQDKSWYAVFRGRDIERPTIFFSTWTQAGQHVIGYSRAKHKKFSSEKEARGWLATLGAEDPDVVKGKATEVTPTKEEQTTYYLVTSGRDVGIKTSWDGPNGAKAAVDGWPAHCYESFNTRAEAEAAMKEWMQSLVSKFSKELQQLLDDGYIPRDNDLDLRSLMYKPQLVDTTAIGVSGLDMESLSLK
jgi:viroplasmin and RNaseH domain-containing protein